MLYSRPTPVGGKRERLGVESSIQKGVQHKTPTCGNGWLTFRVVCTFAQEQKGGFHGVRLGGLRGLS